MKKIFISFAILLTSIFSLFAQKPKEKIPVEKNIDFTKENFSNDKNGLKEALKNFDAGDHFYQVEQVYDKALEYYLKANEFNPNNADLNYKIGVCYLHSAFKNKATAFLEKAYRMNKNISEDIHFHLARAYHLNMEWDKAIKEYNTAKTAMKNAEKEVTDDIAKKILECKNGMELVKKTVNVSIDNMGTAINTQYQEYAPVISADESMLLFTSKRENTTGGGIDPRNGKYYEDVYISTFQDGKWSDAKNMGTPVNSANRHDASVALSADGQKLFIYLDDYQKGGSGNIYECDQVGASWSKPKKLNENINSKLQESSASLSADGTTLYFCRENPESEKKGNDGLWTHDIYKSEWDKKNK